MNLTKFTYLAIKTIDIFTKVCYHGNIECNKINTRHSCKMKFYFCYAKIDQKSRKIFKKGVDFSYWVRYTE